MGATSGQRIVALLNARSGTGHESSSAETVRRLLGRDGAEVEVRRIVAGTDLDREIEAAKASRPDVVVAGGGDGTVSAVAAALVDTDIVLGVLPLGTLNHFAKDLDIPLELEPAARTISAGHTVRIDVGEVNGRVFVNNSSLGLYPEIVRNREQQQRRLGRGKWPALAWATLAALRRYAFLKVTLRIDGIERLRRTPFVFIGNNEYRMEGFSIGERKGSLCDGRLSVYFAQRPGRLRLLALALRALVGRLKQARDFEAVLASDFVIESGIAGCASRPTASSRAAPAASLPHPAREPARRGACRAGAARHVRSPGMRTVAHLSDLHFGRTDPPSSSHCSPG
jgi:diacylglycerol kinase family enzyme